MPKRAEKPKFKVKFEYIPSKDAEERLLRAFEMLLLGDRLKGKKVAEKRVRISEVECHA